MTNFGTCEGAKESCEKKTKKLQTTKAVRQSLEVGQSRVKLPDFRARVRAIYGDKVFQVSGAELIMADRDRY